MAKCGKALADRFRHLQATKVLTAEISGIAPALITGMELGIPVVYARKSKPITMPDQIFLTLAPSHTKGRMVELIVSPEYLGPHERVLIIDDFLASGQTIMGLVRLTQAAGAQIVGIGTLIEKRFEGGRDVFRELQVPIESLAIISDMSDGEIIFETQE
jgi:xanthine phosphoribosyltransferase